MPEGRKYQFSDPPPEAQEQPSSFRRYAAAGTRGLGGLLSGLAATEPGVGSLVGAGIGGGTEFLSELLEGSEPSWKRIGVEAGIGALPGGAFFKAGKPLQSAARGALTAGAGAAMRNLAESDDPSYLNRLNPTQIGASALIGGGVSGGLSHLLGVKAPEVKAPENLEVEPTIRPGGVIAKVAKSESGKSGPAGQGRFAYGEDIPKPRVRQSTEIPYKFGDTLPEVPKVDPLGELNIKMTSGGQGFEDLPLHGTPYGHGGAPEPTTFGGRNDEFPMPEYPPVGSMTPEERLAEINRLNAQYLAEEEARHASDGSRVPYGGATPTAEPERFAGRSDYFPEPAATSTEVAPSLERTPYNPPEPAPYRSAAKAGVKAEEKAASEADKANKLTQLHNFFTNMDDDTIEQYAEQQRRFRMGKAELEAIKAAELASGKEVKMPEPPKPLPVQAPVDVQAPTQAAPKAPPAATENINPAGSTPLSPEDAWIVNPEASTIGAPANPNSGPLTPPSTPEADLGRLLGSGFGEGPTSINPVRPTEVNLGGQEIAAGQAATQATEGATPELAQFFKTRAGAAGKNYRLAKEAAATGEIPTANYAREAVLRENAAKPAPQVTAPKTQPTPGVTFHGEPPPYQPRTTPSLTPEQYSSLNDTAEQDFIEQLMNRAKGESGAINPSVATHIATAGVGALAGGAMDQDNHLRGALIGGTLGAVAPTAISRLAEVGVPHDMIPNLEGMSIKDAAKKVYETLPQIQRFNYLMSAEGLPANALVGPYGSAIMGSLEKALAGDEAGWAALRHLANPVAFGKEWLNSFDEATDLLVKGESRWAEQVRPPSGVEKGLAFPGLAMTAGDVAARRILERAGIPEDVARTITLTSEPETRFGQGAVNAFKGSPFGQMLFPFRRTPINILEQGAQRLPGVGFAVQAARETPDSMKTQLVQQGLGGLVGAGSAVIGANVDPDSRNVGRYLTNFAGQYSLPASLGYAAGQAYSAGNSPVKGAITNFGRSIPVPTTAPITDWLKFLTGEGSAPPGSYPAMFKDVVKEGLPDLGGGTDATIPTFGTRKYSIR